MRTKLEKEIVRRVEELETMSAGTEEYDAKINSVVKLLDRAIELKKIEVDVNDKSRRRDDEKRDQVIRYIMTGTKDVLIVAVTIWGTVASINFEREGTITTSAGRKHLSKLLSWFK